MTATTTSTDPFTKTPAAQPRRGRWIQQWDPEDREFWAASGRQIARRNLVLSVLAENIGFCVWSLWTILVLNLAHVGIKLSLGDRFLVVGWRISTMGRSSGCCSPVPRPLGSAAATSRRRWRTSRSSISSVAKDLRLD